MSQSERNRDGSPRPFRSRMATAVLLGAAVLAASVVLPPTVTPSSAQTGGDVDVTRLWGQDRYETSLAVAERFVQEAGGSIDAAVLVSGTSWHDAVIAAGLAGTLDAPVLLTQPNALPTATAEFLSGAGVSTVVVVGSASAVSDEVVANLSALDSISDVERISGADPAAASVAVAVRMGTPGSMPPYGRTVVIASSEVFADAMVAGGFSARGGHPVLLTPPDSLDAAVASHITASGAQHIIIMGGTAAVSSAVQDELAELGVRVTRLGGSTRLHTAQRVADFLEGKYSNTVGNRCFDRSTAGLATAWVPFDAFSAGPLLGQLCAPLLLADPKGLDPDIARWISRGTGDLLVFGGKAAVSSHALADLSDEAALESIFDNAADERAKIITRLTSKINDGSYGIKNGVLRGPAGFKINLNLCPRGWSDTAGITDTEIRIGHPSPQTGNLAAYGSIAVGMQNYFDWVNEHDPVAGRQIKLQIRDDGYVVAQTVEWVDELIENENVFSVLTLGAGNTVKTYDRINDGCVPHPFVITSHPALGDPRNHPWTTGLGLSYTSETLIWGAWIEQNLGDILPVAVVGLVMDNPYGRTFERAFRDWADEHPEVISEFVAVWHDPPKSELTDEMETVQRLSPDVFISMTSGLPCLGAIEAAGANGLVADIRAKGGALFVPRSCDNHRAYVQPAGEAADGWLIVDRFAKDPTEYERANEPFTRFLNQNLAGAGFSSLNPLRWYGYLYGYPYVEALRIAAELPDGLTRSNFMMAVRALDITHPMLIDGVRFRVNGNNDAFFVEGAQVLRYDARANRWRSTGQVIDINGQTPTCVWSERQGRCN